MDFEFVSPHSHTLFTTDLLSISSFKPVDYYSGSPVDHKNVVQGSEI